MDVSLSDLRKLKPKQWFAGVTMCLGTICPGCLILFWYRRDDFFVLGFPQMLLLSASITLPAVFLNLFVALPRVLTHGKLNFDSEDLIEPAEVYLTACWLAGTALYSALAIGYLFALSFSQFWLAAAGVDILLAIWTWRPVIRGKA